jgi:hypothetical protein
MTPAGSGESPKQKETAFWATGTAALLFVSLSTAQEVLPTPEVAFKDAKNQSHV